MTMPITHSTSNLMPIYSAMPTKQHSEHSIEQGMEQGTHTGTVPNYGLTPEQKNTLQQSVDDTMAAQVEMLRVISKRQKIRI